MINRHKELEEKSKNSNRKEKKKWTKNLNPSVFIKKGTPNLEVNNIREKKLDVIIVSVNYNDFLAVSLQHNIEIFDNITVVTSESDILCQKICEKFGVNCLATNLMYDNESDFNKGKAINYGINSISDPDFILLLDADIIVRGNIDIENLNEELLYTSSRYICKSYTQLNDVISNGKILDESFTHEGDKGIGFFQLFHINHNSIDRDKVYPETSTDASWDDLIFRDKFPKREIIKNTIIHLGDPYTNWKGRKSNRFLKDEEIINILTKKSTFTICSYYFDFNNNPKQNQNLKKFVNQFKNYEDNLIIAIPEKTKFNLKVNCEIVRVPVESNLWSKEILINKIVEQVDTDYFIWIDNDIIYDNIEWLNNLDTLFRKKDFAQLFSKINYLDESGKITDSFESIMSSGLTNVDDLLKSGLKPGGAWLAKTNIIKSKPLFEKMYVGGGDTVFVYGLFGEKNGWTLSQVRIHNHEIYDEATNWISNFGKFRVGFLEEEVKHLYHGELKDRNYNTRYSQLSQYLTKVEEEISESNIIEEYYTDKKIVVYTCISGSYDTLKEVVNPEPNIKYICFTDQDIQSETWEVRRIPEFLNYLEQTKRARCLKILPHLFLKEFDISIWIDGSIEIKGNINKLIVDNLKSYFAICKHPDRICTYKEAESIIRLNKDVPEIVYKQIEKYRNLGFPENHGMVQSGIIIRKHNDDICKSISINWWSELLKWSKRDQLSFNFSIWNKDFNIDVMNPSLIVSEYFQIYTHSDKGLEKVKLRKGYDSLLNYINNKQV
jgi:hypothetical protein